MTLKYSVDEVRLACSKSNCIDDLAKYLGLKKPSKQTYNLIAENNIDISHFKNPKKGRTKYHVGAKFGDFEVIETFAKPRNRGKSLRYYCKCKCKCGNEVIHECAYFLKYKMCDICGLNVDRTTNSKYHGTIPIIYFNHLKNRAKTKKLDFNLTLNYLDELFLKQQKQCSISGISLILHADGVLNTASLDRIDSSKGYIQGNVQWVFTMINMMKSMMSNDDFIYMCRIISDKTTTIDNQKLNQIWSNFRNSTFNKRGKKNYEIVRTEKPC